ncbi:GNAT family N-acetyltransferase [Lentibacillus sp. CBA3610]|uniref:GNAT family N-acetyltransferase n=1 Tax=Lentibacillus sp. CBA3610 TaxID=2518176 RepID=UPI001595D9D4|nr:GNAT family protein [Lentibacillus sp. CBA3610]QKY70800.1 N-acetyltransferase [Lentibacillus sp. CBA3610]
MFLFEIDEEIALKHLEVHDAAPLFRLTDESRTTLRPWLAWVDHTKTVEDSKTFIESALKQFADKRGLTTGILYHGELAGVVGFNHLDRKNNIGVIGYWLGSKYVGKGIMTRAVSGLIDYAFYSLGLNRIEIRAASANKQSRAIPERLGFVQEGQLRQTEWLYNHYVDHVVYGMLAHEWREK